MATIQVIDRKQVVHRLEAPLGSTLMETLRDEGMGVEAVCGGQCACATCHCLVDAQWCEVVGPPGEDEIGLLSTLEHFDAERSRLSCQIEITESLNSLSISIAPDE